MGMFGANGINSMPAPIIPNQQVVIPQITIPQGLSATQPFYGQLTAKGADAAKNIKLPPKVKAAIFDEDEEVFYFRETDALGNDIDFGVYSYAKVEDPSPPEYLTVQDAKSMLEEFAKKLKEDLSNGQLI